MEQKQELRLDGLPKKEYQVVEVNGMKLDYFDFDLAKTAVSSEILKVQKELRDNPELKGVRHYNSMLHTLEEKLQYILAQMEQPPENIERPAGFGITFDSNIIKKQDYT